MKKKIVCIFICVLMLCTATMPALAEEEPQEKVYTALGDSITAGYGLESSEAMDLLLQNNYYKSSSKSFPCVVGEALDAIVYNLGIEGAMSTDALGYMTDPDFVSPHLMDLIHMLFPDEDEAYFHEFAESIKYHYLIMTALKKSDLITIEFGGNDLMQGLADGLSEIAFNEDGEVVNPLANCILSMGYGFIVNGSNMNESLFEACRKAIEECVDKITMQDVMEMLNFFSDSNMNKIIKESSDQTAAAYDAMTDLIKNGKEITKEEYDYILACYADADEKLPTASEDAAEGAISEKELLTNGRLEVYEEGGKYYIAPINPDAQLMLMGLYNIGGDNYILTGKDYAEIAQYGMKIVSLVAKAIMPAESGYDSMWVRTYEDTGIWFKPAQNDAAEKSEDYNNLLKDAQTEIKESPELLEEAAPEALASNSDLLDIISDLMETLPYSIMYLTLGYSIEDSVYYFNSGISDVADKYNVPYVDLINLVADGDFDPHPNADGHAYIAKQILKLIENKKTVAMINSTEYETLAEAVAAIKNGETIRLTSDVDENIVVDRAVGFYLNTNGKKFSGSITADSGYQRTVKYGYYTFTKKVETKKIISRFTPSYKTQTAAHGYGFMSLPKYTVQRGFGLYGLLSFFF